MRGFWRGYWEIFASGIGQLNQKSHFGEECQRKELVQRCVSVIRRGNVALVSQGVKCEDCTSDHLSLLGPLPFLAHCPSSISHSSVYELGTRKPINHCLWKREEGGRKKGREGGMEDKAKQENQRTNKKFIHG